MARKARTSSDPSNPNDRLSNKERDKIEDVISNLAFGRNEWFQIPKRFLTSELLTKNEAILLAFLIAHAHRCDKRKDWFFCTTEQIQDGVGFLGEMQRLTLKSLATKNLLRTGREKGKMPSRRMIVLHWANIARLITDAKPTFNAEDCSEFTSESTGYSNPEI